MTAVAGIATRTDGFDADPSGRDVEPLPPRTNAAVLARGQQQCCQERRNEEEWHDEGRRGHGDQSPA